MTDYLMIQRVTSSQSFKNWCFDQLSSYNTEVLIQMMKSFFLWFYVLESKSKKRHPGSFPYNLLFTRPGYLQRDQLNMEIYTNQIELLNWSARGEMLQAYSEYLNITEISSSGIHLFSVWKWGLSIKFLTPSSNNLQKQPSVSCLPFDYLNQMMH